MRRSWIIALLIAASATAWIVSGLPFGDATEPGEPAATEPRAESPPPPTVRVADVTAQQLDSTLVLQARTLADRNVTIRAETTGLVVEVLVERGDRVRQGDVMIRIAVDERQARLEEAEALVEQRAIEFNAAATLNQRGYTADTARAESAARLAEAQAQLELARLALDKTIIRAPFDGMVDNRYAEVGDFLDIADHVLQLVDLDPIRVRGEISERRLGHIDFGVSGSARFLDGSEEAGQVTYIGSIANEATRTFPVEIELPNPNGRIIEGITAELRLPVRQVMAHRVSPSLIGLSDDGVLGVKAVGEDNRVAFHPVEVLADSPEGIWLGGLPESLSLIVVGQEYVRPGQLVQPVYQSVSAAEGS